MTIDSDSKSEFEEHLLANIDSLYNLGVRLTGNKEEAQDLVQEASLRAYNNYSKFERGTNFKAWSLTILRNLFINQYRKKKRQPTTINYHEYEGFENFISVPEVSGFAEEIFSEHVQKSIDVLPEELRSVLILFYVEGLAYKEIAEVMSCPIGTVMSRLFMARQILKKRLSEVMGKEGINNEMRRN